KALERVLLVVRSEDLEIAKSHEARRDAAHDCAGLLLRMTVVEHVARHRLTGGDEAQRTRRRHAEMEHRLAAHEFAQRRAQYSAAIGRAGVGRRPRAFQLQLLARAIGGDDFGERDRATVAKLPGPVPELVAAITRRIRLHPW